MNILKSGLILCAVLFAGVANAQPSGSAGQTQEQSILNSILAAVAAPRLPASGTPTETAVTCGTSTTTLLAAATATQFVMLRVSTSAASTVWVNVAGSAAVLASPSIDVPVGSSLVWSNSGYLPTSQINCIASASTVVTLVYK